MNLEGDKFNVLVTVKGDDPVWVSEVTADDLGKFLGILTGKEAGLLLLKGIDSNDEKVHAIFVPTEIIYIQIYETSDSEASH